MKAQLTLLTLLLLSSSNASADLIKSRGSRHPGWSVALGSAITNIDLNEDRDQLFSRGPVDIDEVGRGGFLSVGYAFANDFAVQLQMTGAEHSTGDRDLHFASGGVDLEALAYLKSHGAIRPYVAGGFGAAAVVLADDDSNDEDVLVGGSLSMGGGVQAYLSSRWWLSFDYRYGIQNYEEEHYESDDVVEIREVDLSSSSHRLRFGVGFSF